jgi:hypothetical protein
MAGRHEDGYLLVEVIVTLVAATLFLGGIFSLYTTQTQLSGSVSFFNNADRLAYNNLRIYANGRSPTWFTCTYVSGAPQSVTLVSSTSAVDGVPSPVIQSVVATAPYGCGGGSTGLGYPIRVVSSVTYGLGARKVVHATYATF